MASKKKKSDVAALVTRMNRRKNTSVDTLSPKEFLGSSTGFYDLDELIIGLCPGELYLIAGPTGTGKSSLCTNVASHICLHDQKRTLYYSLNSTLWRWSQRWLCSEAAITLGQLERPRENHLADSDNHRISHACKNLAGMPLTVRDEVPLSTVDVTHRIEEFAAEDRAIELLVIDPLQLLDSEELTPLASRPAAALRELKFMARRFNIPVLVASDLAVSTTERKESATRLSDLFDYQNKTALFTIPDVVILLNKSVPEYEGSQFASQISDVEIAKNRNGKTGKLNLGYQSEFFRFTNLARERV